MLTVAEVANPFGVARRWPKLLASSATGKLNMDRPLALRHCQKWGKHPACRVFLLINRKLEAYATNLQPEDSTVTMH